ncbi:MAG: Bacterial alpha-L-rhamnosidase [Chitinivibrionales bacterium]|nr:Bacterial alpha-L-rhamnosidase [Chitinivibrionales bacterium]
MYRALAEQTRQSMRRLLWDDTRGVFVDNRRGETMGSHVSMHANAMAILSGAATDEQAQRAAEYILDPSRGARKTQPFFSHFLLEALHRVGRTREALAFVRENWGTMVAAGSTTTWERWSLTSQVRYGGRQAPPEELDRETMEPYPASMAHAWSASPTWFLPSRILGIRPTSPGFSRFVVEPVLAGLAEANGGMPTPSGDIAVEMRKEKAMCQIRVTTPHDCRGELLLPAAPTRIEVDNEAVSIASLAGGSSNRLSVPLGAGTTVSVECAV